LSKHSAVIASIHQRFVKTGKLDKEQGKALNWLFELRSVGDYGGTAHVSRQEVEQAIQASGKNRMLLLQKKRPRSWETRGEASCFCLV